MIVGISQTQEISGFVDNSCDRARFLLSGSINLNESSLNFEVEVPNEELSVEVISIKIKNFDGDQFSRILFQAKSSEDASLGTFTIFNSTT